MAKKQVKKEITEVGKVIITSSFNNTIVSITNTQGDTICYASAGSVGFKGSRKSTPYAATVAATEAAKKALNAGVKQVSVYIKGPGSGRDSAVKAIRQAGLNIIALADITPMPHNGCRPRNRRKV